MRTMTPPRTSTETLKLRGSPLAKKRQATAQDSRPGNHALTWSAPAPDCLVASPDGAALTSIWSSLVEQLAALGVLHPADQHAMEMYCRLVVLMRQAKDTKELRRCRTAMQHFEDRFGMNPAARHRLGIRLSPLQAPEPLEIDPAAEFCRDLKKQ